jgi:EF hand
MSRTRRWPIGACLVSAMAIWGEGCSHSPSRIAAPHIDPERTGAAVIAAYDRDGDGKLSKLELKKCPALLASLAAYDTNKDDKIDAEEIAARLKSWEATRVGITAAPLIIRLDGRPLVGATVLLEPEPFLEGTLMPASAETNASGFAGLSMAAENLPKGVRSGVQPGLYKIRLKHPTQRIPAKFNEETEIGLEVQPLYDIFNPPVLDLKSN